MSKLIHSRWKFLWFCDLAGVLTFSYQLWETVTVFKECEMYLQGVFSSACIVRSFLSYYLLWGVTCHIIDASEALLFISECVLMIYLCQKCLDCHIKNDKMHKSRQSKKNLLFEHSCVGMYELN